MSKISGKETKPEIQVRKYLFSKGFRYRKNVVDLPGKPDIVLRKFKTVIFINGCFWHNHQNCNKSKLPETNVDFWTKKINQNVDRDRANIAQLESAGWKVITIWQCELKNKSVFNETLENLTSQIVR